jgi:hypothetical protein
MAYNGAMDDDLPAIRETLKFLSGSDIPVQHKKILTAVLEEALSTALQKQVDNWQPAELQMIADALQGRVAISWQHADELLFKLAGQLQRSPDEVKKKAIAAGFGAAVDYWQAKKARSAGENI